MTLRLLEIYLPATDETVLKDILNEHAIIDVRQQVISKEILSLRIVMEAEHTESLIELLQNRFRAVDSFRLVIIPVEATLPRPESEQASDTNPPDQRNKEESKKTARISREELYADIEETTKLSWIFVVMVILSAIVAAIGLLRNNVAIIIGAMVIAPLLGPNVALSLATTLGDIPLARRSLITNGIGISTAIFFACGLGLLLDVDPTIPEIASRTTVGIGDVILALAAGSAATLAFTAGAPSALIGVMVAVALMPPLITVGILLGSAYWHEAFGALLLLLVNLICVNLSGVTSFLVQGIRPINWWQADKAKRATRQAITVWTILLLLLIAIILFSQQN